MAGLNWRLGPDGTLQLCPVLGWETALLAGMACGLQLQIFRSAESLAALAPELEQVVMTPAQARLLAEDLMKMASLAESRPSGPPQG